MARTLLLACFLSAWLFGAQGYAADTIEDYDACYKLQKEDRKWSLKEMHRRIVTSHAYRQSSAERPDVRERDPHNYLLARQQRLRLDGEIVRDVALAASGLLSPKLGGPPVYPPLPDGVMGQGQVKRAWTVSQGEDKFRRGIYTFDYRATPPPSLNVFDAPDGFSTCTRRLRSNTPLQALTLMNDSGFFEFATALEKIIRQDGPAPAFRRCTSRPPRAEELAVFEKLDTLTAARAQIRPARDRAARVLGIRRREVDPRRGRARVPLETRGPGLRALRGIGPDRFRRDPAARLRARAGLHRGAHVAHRGECWPARSSQRSARGARGWCSL